MPLKELSAEENAVIRKRELRRKRKLALSATVEVTGDHEAVVSCLMELDGSAADSLQRILALACWPHGVKLWLKEID